MYHKSVFIGKNLPEGVKIIRLVPFVHNGSIKHCRNEIITSSFHIIVCNIGFIDFFGLCQNRSWVKDKHMVSKGMRWVRPRAPRLDRKSQFVITHLLGLLPQLDNLGTFPSFFSQFQLLYLQCQHLE